MTCLQYPGGESESPYVFIMENPCELVVKFPIKGQHKICEYLAIIYAPVNNTPHYPTPVLYRGIDRELTGVSPEGR